jgi:hypothetical protein
MKHQANAYILQSSNLRHLPSESAHQAVFYLHGFTVLHQTHNDTHIKQTKTLHSTFSHQNTHQTHSQSVATLQAYQSGQSTVTGWTDSCYFSTNYSRLNLRRLLINSENVAENSVNNVNFYKLSNKTQFRKPGY